jgi:hypothetical protein
MLKLVMTLMMRIVIEAKVGAATCRSSSRRGDGPSRESSRLCFRDHRLRSRVVDVFHSAASHLQLAICYLMEYSEDWPTDRSCIKREKVQEALERGRAFLTAQTAS